MIGAEETHAEIERCKISYASPSKHAYDSKKTQPSSRRKKRKQKVRESKENAYQTTKSPSCTKKPSHNRSNTVPTIKFFERALKINQETAPFSNESPINDTSLKQ